MIINTTKDTFVHCPMCNGKAIYNKEQDYLHCISNCEYKPHKFGNNGRFMRTYEKST